MDSTTYIILLISLIAGIFLIRKLLTMFYTKKLVNEFTNHPDQFEKVLDSKPVRLLFEIFNREFMRLNYFITYSKKGKVDEQVEKIEKMKLNKQQRFTIFQLLLQYYISIDEEKKARKLQKRYNAFIDENNLDKVLKYNMDMELKIHFEKDLTTLSYIDSHLNNCMIQKELYGTLKKQLY